jgi:hypothetical protein
MNTQKLEIQINNDNMIDIKNKIKHMSLKYEENPFLNDVLFIEISEDKLCELKAIKNITIEKEKYASY